MNAHAVKALFFDALYQILDNWVFRILTVLGGMLVLATFLVGFRETEIVLKRHHGMIHRTTAGVR